MCVFKCVPTQVWDCWTRLETDTLEEGDLSDLLPEGETEGSLVMEEVPPVW
jgi:hypothetical protein